MLSKMFSIKKKIMESKSRKSWQYEVAIIKARHYNSTNFCGWKGLNFLEEAWETNSNWKQAHILKPFWTFLASFECALKFFNKTFHLRIKELRNYNWKLFLCPPKKGGNTTNILNTLAHQRKYSNRKLNFSWQHKT